MKKSLILAALLVVALGTPPFANAFDKKPKTIVREVNIEGRYSMMLPTYLTEGDDLNDEASLQYQNIYKEVYIIVIDEPKQDFIDVFMDLNDYDTTKTPLENYVEAQIESIRGNMNKVIKEKRRSLQSGCGQAVIYDVTGTQDGIDDAMGFTVGFYEGKLNLYMIMTWTFANSQKEYQEDMDNMLISFKELSGAIGVKEAAYTTPQYNFDITIPAFMDRDTTIPNATIEFYGSTLDYHIAVLEEPTAKWDSLYASSGSNTISFLDFFSLAQKKQFEKNLKSIHNVSELTKSRTSGLDAQTFTCYGIPAGQTTEMYYKIRLVQGKKQLYIIQAWTPTSKQAGNNTPMNEIMDTFKEVE